jgi:ribosomal protein L37AE/L43A
MKCSFCNNETEYLIKKNDIYVCDKCVEEFVNAFINNGVNIQLKIKNFKIKKIK